MDTNNLQRLRETLAKNNNFAIVTGEKPSIDEMAATLSLFLMLKQAEKKVIVACPSEPIVEVSSLVGIDKVQTNLGGEAGDLVVSFPYVEGEIEKVSYTLEDGYLNIIVKSAEQGLTFDEKDVKYTRGSGKIDVLFVIGTPRLSLLGNLFDSEKLKNVRIINIDNKQENQGFGDIVMVSPNLSSVSEQIADLALSLGFRIDKDVAQNLLSGISFATKNFQDPFTSPLAFEMASLLMKKGASRGRDDAAREAAVSMPRREERQQFPPRRDENRRFPDQRHDENKPQPQRNPQRFQQEQRGNQNQFQDRNQVTRNQQPVQQQPQQRPDQKERTQEEEGTKPPIDWLAPKVYKGSSNF
jgi:hypothetical protein